jgi:hypothetical protein
MFHVEEAAMKKAGLNGSICSSHHGGDITS